MLTVQTCDLPQLLSFKVKILTKTQTVDADSFPSLKSCLFQMLVLPHTGKYEGCFSLIKEKAKGDSHPNATPLDTKLQHATPLIPGVIKHVYLCLIAPIWESQISIVIPVQWRHTFPSACLSWLYSSISSSHHVNIPAANISF